MKTIFKSFFFVTVLALVMTGCQKETNEYDVRLKSSVVPVLYDDTDRGGNVECAELPIDYAFSSGRINYEDGSFAGPFPAGFSVWTDGTYVNWSYQDPDGIKCLDGISVIVKGSNAANVYTYGAGVSGDTGLRSPDNSSGGPAGLSNLTFCYNLVECEKECEWVGHTAFGGNLAGAGSAWWFYFDSSIEGPQAIYAGQMLVEGASVNIDKISGLLTIVLGENLRLQAAIPIEKTNKKGVTYWDPNNEQVKVQGYSVLPMSRPAAGGFTLYKGRDLVIDLTKGGTLNLMPYYVIHLDVEVKVCPEPEM